MRPQIRPRIFLTLPLRGSCKCGVILMVQHRALQRVMPERTGRIPVQYDGNGYVGGHGRDGRRMAVHTLIPHIPLYNMFQRFRLNRLYGIKAFFQKFNP